MIGQGPLHAVVGRQGHGLIALMVMAVALEIGWRLVRRRGYDMGETYATLGVAAGNLVSGVLTAAAVGAVYAFVWRFAPWRWPLGDWRTWAAGFLAVEFAYYWFHRLSHVVRWLWATHAVHHTPRQMTFLSALRLGWTNGLSGGWLVYLLLVLLGFDPRLVVALLAFDLHYQFFLHTEAGGGLGPLGWVLNTPAHHRVHHGSNSPYLDRNFGGVLIIFDRLFGTFAAERPDEPVRYGLVHPAEGRDPLSLALFEWRRLFQDLGRTRGLAQAFRVALGPPA